MSITKIGRAIYYDLHVPGPENYLAEGLIHHNSGKTPQIMAVAEHYLKQGNPVVIASRAGVLKITTGKNPQLTGSYAEWIRKLGLTL